jgi:alkylhydroperoxidase family enzyme
LARRLGVDDRTLDDLVDYARSDAFSAGEKAILSAAVALTREPRALPPAVAESLREHYDEGEIIEIVTTIALFNALNRLTNALENTNPASETG